MKKLFLLIGLISLVSLTSCKKEQAVNTRLTATIENGAKTYFNISDETPNPGVVTWKAGDEVWVDGYQFTAANLSDDGQTADLESDASPEAPYTAIYPYSAASTNEGYHYVTLPATQEYTGNEVHAPLYAYSEGNTLQFQNLCGMLVLNLQAEGKTLQSIEVAAASGVSLSGTFKINETGDNPALDGTNVSDGGNTVTLDCGEDGVSINTATNFYIYLPPANYSALEFTFTDMDGNTCTKTFQAGGNDHNTFDVVRSQYNLLTFELTFAAPVPTGAINGLFTVNASGAQVRFSQGNLQYIGSAATPYWKFADSQWERLGNNGQVSTSTTVDRDLFGWGTSGWNSGANAYMPYSTSQDYSDYYPGGSENNDLTDDYAEADWAWHNAISNGGNAAHLWRTLTSAEWDYLFNTRATTTNLGTDNARYAKGKVNNVQGVILFPDNYTHPTGITAPTGINNTGSTGWSGNSYTLAQWADMEAAGAVFLPAAGRRWGSNSVLNVGNIGFYWSSTHYDDFDACYVFFSSDNLDAADNDYRRYGFAVRPVHVAN